MECLSNGSIDVQIFSPLPVTSSCSEDSLTTPTSLSPPIWLAPPTSLSAPTWPAPPTSLSPPTWIAPPTLLSPPTWLNPPLLPPSTWIAPPTSFAPPTPLVAALNTTSMRPKGRGVTPTSKGRGATPTLKGENATPTLKGQDKESLATPPLDRSTPTGGSTGGSVRVRVSARKLREIASPYTSDISSVGGQSAVFAASPAAADSAQHPPAPPPRGVADLEQRQSKQRSKDKGLRHSVKLDQRKGGALKQGILLESFHSNLSAPDDGSILVSLPTSSLSPTTDSRRSKLKLLNECAVDDGTSGAPSHRNPPHQVHVITSKPPSTPRHEGVRVEREKATALCAPGLLTKQDEVVLVGARRSLSAEGSVMDRGPEDGKCGCVCRGGVSEEEAVKTAQLVATCTAAATAAVLKATVDAQGLGGQGVSGVSQGASDGVASGVAQARETQLPLGHLVGPAQDGENPGSHLQDAAMVARVNQQLQDRGRKHRDRKSRHQDRARWYSERSQHRNRDQDRDWQYQDRDSRHQDRSLGGDGEGEVRMHEVLRRLQMLEDAKTPTPPTLLTQRPKVSLDSPKPWKGSPATSGPHSVVRELPSHQGNQSATCTCASHHQGNQFATCSHQGNQSATVPACENEAVASQEASLHPGGNEKQWMLQESGARWRGSENSEKARDDYADHSPHADHSGPSSGSHVDHAPHAGPSPHDGSSAKAFQEEVAEIEKVLQRVRLSWKEEEFQSSVAEMEDEGTHMKTILQSLTNYSNTDEGNIDKISAALSEYLSQLPSLPPGASLPKSQGTGTTAVSWGRGGARGGGAEEKRKKKRRKEANARRIPFPGAKGIKSRTLKVQHATERNYCNDNDHSSTNGGHDRDITMDHSSRNGGHDRENGALGCGGGAQDNNGALGGGGVAQDNGHGTSRNPKPAHEEKYLHHVAIPLRAPCVMPSPLHYTISPQQHQGTQCVEVGHQCVEVGLQASFTSTNSTCEEVQLVECDHTPPQGSATPTQLDQISATPTQHDQISATPTQHDQISATPTQHDQISATPTQHDQISATPTQHDQISATPTQHDQISALPTQLEHISATPIFSKPLQIEHEPMTSEELDDMISAHLEARAVEWVQSELMARMLSQVQLSPQRPITPPHVDGHTTPTSSTCSSPHSVAAGGWGMGGAGLQVFVGAGVEVDDGVMEEEVRGTVREHLVRLLRELSAKQGVDSGRSQQTSIDSYTPLSSPSPSGSRSSSPFPSPPVSTPPLAPPTQQVTPDTEQACSPLTTPTCTPPPLERLEEEELYDAVTTPQESQASTSSHDITTTSPPTCPTISTPNATPPATSLSIVVTPEESKPTTCSEKTSPPHKQSISLSTSASSSSTSTEAPPPNLSATPSSATDNPVSLGEYILKSHTPLPWPVANSSLSEGEVPLSPGDVRWNALCTTKVKAALDEQDSTRDAFLDLKNSPDPSIGSSDSQINVYSVGEVQERGKHLVNFEHLRDKATPTIDETTPTSDDNTLTDLPSLKWDVTRHKTSSPVPLGPATKLRDVADSATKLWDGQHSKRREGRRMLGGQTSPGEVKKPSLHVNLRASEVTDVSFGGVSVGGVSEGEVPAVISKRIRVWAEGRSDASKRNKTRDGIDVISISKSTTHHSPKHHSPKHSPATSKRSPATSKHSPATSKCSPATPQHSPQHNTMTPSPQQSPPHAGTGKTLISVAPSSPGNHVISLTPHGGRVTVTPHVTLTPTPNAIVDPEGSEVITNEVTHLQPHSADESFLSLSMETVDLPISILPISTLASATPSPSATPPASAPPPASPPSSTSPSATPPASAPPPASPPSSPSAMPPASVTPPASGRQLEVRIPTVLAGDDSKDSSITTDFTSYSISFD